MLRITGGIYRGRIIKAIESKDLRPTTSFFREWLFNVLNNYTDLEQCHLLDLFAGSGVVGFEFLSRGASKVTFIESSAKVTAQLKENALNLKAEDQINIRQQEVCSFLELQNCWHDANFIFLDPPYQAELPNRVLSLINKLHPDKDNLFIIIESQAKYQFEFPSNWSILKQKSTGTTMMSVLVYTKCCETKLEE